MGFEFCKVNFCLSILVLKTKKTNLNKLLGKSYGMTCFKTYFVADVMQEIERNNVSAICKITL